MLMAMVVAGSSSPFCGRSNPFLLNDANDLVYNPDGNGDDVGNFDASGDVSCHF